MRASGDEISSNASRSAVERVVGHLEDGGEQLPLAVREVVVKRTPGHPGPLEDRRDGGRLVAALGEALPAGLHQRGP